MLWLVQECRSMYTDDAAAYFYGGIAGGSGDDIKPMQQRKSTEGTAIKLAPFSKMALIFVVASNSSGVAPYIRHMNLERMKVAGVILLLAAGGYAIGLLIARLMHQDRETQISMMYGAGMRNISAGAVIAATSFPGEVLFPVMIGTLFQQVLAALYGKIVCERNKDK